MFQFSFIRYLEIDLSELIKITSATDYEVLPRLRCLPTQIQLVIV